jgi:hypothetical protein
MPSEIQYSLSRTLPSSVQHRKVISLLHDHPNIIKLSPIVVDYHEVIDALTSSTDQPANKTYAITDAISYLPFGLYKGTVTVNVDFTNEEDGVLVKKYAPLGITIAERWLVRNTTQSSGNVDERQVKAQGLSLGVTMSGNGLALRMFESMMRKNHESYLDSFTSLTLELAV